MYVEAPPERVYSAFVEPEFLTRFWLSEASGPLRVGQAVDWSFMVAGAQDTVTATRLDPHKQIAWQWSDGAVQIDLEAFAGGTAITLIQDEFSGGVEEQVEAALNGTEGFSIVLCDLKTLLESGKSAGLTKSKARLIEARL